MSETNRHPIGEVMGLTMQKVKEMIDANTIVGEPDPGGRRYAGAGVEDQRRVWFRRFRFQGKSRTRTAVTGGGGGAGIHDYARRFPGDLGRQRARAERGFRAAEHG